MRGLLVLANTVKHVFLELGGIRRLILLVNNVGHPLLLHECFVDGAVVASLLNGG